MNLLALLCCRQNHAAYSFVVNLIIPGSPVLSLVAVFINEHHPSILEQQQQSRQAKEPQADPPGALAAKLSTSVVAEGSAAEATIGGSSSSKEPATPNARSQSNATVIQSVTEMFQRTPSITHVASSTSNGKAEPESSCHSSSSRNPTKSSRAIDADGASSSYSSSPESKNTPASPAAAFAPDKWDWEPFDYTFRRFLNASDQERTSMLKLIPGIAEGSWVIKQSVGTVPVIVGTKLKTTYYQMDRYIEAAVDVTSSSAAAYITGKYWDMSVSPVVTCVWHLLLLSNFILLLVTFRCLHACICTVKASRFFGSSEGHSGRL